MDEIWDLIGSVSEGVPTYSKKPCCKSDLNTVLYLETNSKSLR